MKYANEITDDVIRLTKYYTSSKGNLPTAIKILGLAHSFPVPTHFILVCW